MFKREKPKARRADRAVRVLTSADLKRVQGGMAIEKLQLRKATKKKAT